MKCRTINLGYKDTCQKKKCFLNRFCNDRDEILHFFHNICQQPQRCRSSVASTLLPTSYSRKEMYLSREAGFSVFPASRSALIHCRKRAESVVTPPHKPKQKDGRTVLWNTGDTYRGIRIRQTRLFFALFIEQ